MKAKRRRRGGIAAADIYLTPYLNVAQIVSGTLAYAYGSGKAVVSTPFWHAEELLAEDHGVLVPFNDPGAIAHEVRVLLGDDLRRHALRKNACIQGREMVWSNVAHHYMHSFERARVDRSRWSRKVFATKTLDQQLSQVSFRSGTLRTRHFSLLALAKRRDARHSLCLFQERRWVTDLLCHVYGL